MTKTLDEVLREMVDSGHGYVKVPTLMLLAKVPELVKSISYTLRLDARHHNNERHAVLILMDVLAVAHSRMKEYGDKYE